MLAREPPLARTRDASLDFRATPTYLDWPLPNAAPPVVTPIATPVAALPAATPHAWDTTTHSSSTW